MYEDLVSRSSIFSGIIIMIMPLASRVRFGKLLDRLLDPSAFEGERLTAIKMAHKLCADVNLSPSDALGVTAEMYLEAHYLPKKKLIDRIAELEISLKCAERRERSQVKSHRSEFEAEISRNQRREAELLAEIVAKEEIVAQLQAQALEIEVVVDEDCANKVLTSSKKQRTNETTDASTEQRQSTHVILKDWNKDAWESFERLAVTGKSKTFIAKELSCNLGRLVTTACVTELMRLRWSSRSGRRYALWGCS